MLSRLSCSGIIRLSIADCSEKALLSLCPLAPNLVYLKVKQLACTDDRSNLNPALAFTPQSTRLEQLHIISTTNRLNDLRSIGKLIDYYQSSLERLTLEISLNNPVDGYDLQRILKRCQHLKKLTFAFSCWLEDTEMIDVLRSFQSDWWLDSHRPPVLIFCSNYCEILVVSMPCHLDDYLWFPVDLEDWLVNKAQLDSPEISFTKQKCIRFVNSHHRPITLDLVHVIGHVFRAAKQELSIPHWRFLAPDLLLEQVSCSSNLLLHLISCSAVDQREICTTPAADGRFSRFKRMRSRPAGREDTDRMAPIGGECQSAEHVSRDHEC